MWKKSRVQLYSTVAALGLILAVSGCAKKTTQTGEVAPPSDSATARDSRDKELLTDAGKGDIFSKGGRSTAPMVSIYYDFDRSDIRPDQQSNVKGNWSYLKANPQIRVRIEGNCDERGTAEYNLALGERRALSAKKYLANLGMPADRIDTLSLGEERPLIDGHDEVAWEQNRRGDFVAQK